MAKKRRRRFEEVNFSNSPKHKETPEYRAEFLTSLEESEKTIPNFKEKFVDYLIFNCETSATAVHKTKNNISDLINDDNKEPENLAELREAFSEAFDEIKNILVEREILSNFGITIMESFYGLSLKNLKEFLRENKKHS